MPYDRILDLMTVPDEPGLFVLGAYARRVTIYSQQARAINLIDALQCYRKKLSRTRIAVIGGGIAGLTAAARALEYGAHVTVLEQAADFLGIQSMADHRWVLDRRSGGQSGGAGQSHAEAVGPEHRQGRLDERRRAAACRLVG
jgi:hypothetical protein